MRILLTGATGSLGSALADYLLGRGDTVVAYARDEYKQAMLKLRHPGKPLISFLGDVRNLQRLQEAAKNCDLVIHAAALKRLDYENWNSTEIADVNIMGTKNVATLPMQKLFISTDKAYEPTSGYGMTKKIAEEVILSSPNSMVIRLGNLIGSRGSVLEIWERQREFGVITITDPEPTRFWMTIEQAVLFIMHTLGVWQEGRTVIPQGLRGFKILDLASVVAPHADKRFIGLYRGEKLHESFSPEYRSDMDIMSKEALKIDYESLRRYPTI